MLLLREFKYLCMAERDHIGKIMKKQRHLFVFSIKSSQAKCHKKR